MFCRETIISDSVIFLIDKFELSIELHLLVLRQALNDV